ncbi:MAG: dienelactone hydrolase family protein [Caulobacteraceae bacterium]
MSGAYLTIPTPDGEFKAYVARPAAATAPVVVVIQEIFGVNAVMRQVADNLAAQGYLAIAPDLFWRIEPGVDITDKSQAEWERAFALMNAFDVDKGMEDIQTTLTFARQMPGANGKAGVVGYCLGGKLAFLAATRTDSDASVSYYGVGLDAHLAEVERLSRPLMLHIAEQDKFSDDAARERILTGLKNHAQVEVITYPDRDHAFAREGGEHYDAADAAKANERTVGLFKRTLG